MSWKRSVRRCALLSILFAVVAGCQRAAPTVVTPSPPWTVLTPVVELTATEDEKSSSQLAIVQLKNISQSPASIAGIQTGCGCATVESVPQTPIAAGAVAEIKIRVRLPDYGEQVLRVRIETSPPSTVPVEVELKLHGKVWPVPRLIYPIDDVRLTPPFKTTATKTFTILTWEKKGSTPWLRGFRADPPRCRLELPDPPTEREFTNEFADRALHCGSGEGDNLTSLRV